MTMASADAADPEVFVVDDDPSARDALAALLIAAGFRVALFADGASVMTEARARTPACILLDLYMPGGSGLDILARLDAKRYAAPVIVVSAKATSRTWWRRSRRRLRLHRETPRARDPGPARARGDRRGG
jgi:FixJ family two-component response regulator